MNKEIKDYGTIALIQDLENLLTDAKVGEFGDFTNNKYPAPKIALRNLLIEMADNVVKGKYD